MRLSATYSVCLAAISFVIAISSAQAVPRTVTFVNDIAELKALGASSSSYPVVEVGGYNYPGDWGGGRFKYDPASTVTPNQCDVFQPTGVTTGRYIRDRVGTDVYVEQCGAWHNNTHGPETVAAFQAAIDLVGASANKEATIYVLGPDYATDNSTTVVKSYNYYCPNIVGGGYFTTNYHFQPSTDKAAFRFTDTTKGVCRGGLSNLRFVGNSHTIPVEIRDQNGPTLDYRVSEAKIGLLLNSYAYGYYAEHVHAKLYIDDCALLADRVVVRYHTENGSGSFKDSGLIDGTNISAMTGACSITAINAGSQPYQIPMSPSIFVDEANVVLINNDSSNTISAYGQMKIEVGLAGAITLGSGTSTNYAGTINKLSSGDFNYGTFTFSTINGTGGAGGFVAASNQVQFSENTDGTNPQYLTGGANKTTVFATDFPTNRTATYYVALAGPYDWTGIVDVFDNTAGAKSIAMRGNLFAGSAAPTFSMSSGKLAVTVPDNISANSVVLSWVKYTPNEFGH